MKKVLLGVLEYFILICIGFALPFVFVGVIDLLTLCSFSYVKCVTSVPFVLCEFITGVPISMAIADDYSKRIN